MQRVAILVPPLVLLLWAKGASTIEAMGFGPLTAWLLSLFIALEIGGFFLWLLGHTTESEP